MKMKKDLVLVKIRWLDSELQRLSCMLFKWGCLCKPLQFAAVGLGLRIGCWVRVGAKLNCDLRWAQHFSRSAFPGRVLYAGWALHRRRWPCKWNSTVGVCHGLLAVILKTSTCETSSTSTSTSTCETQPLQSCLRSSSESTRQRSSPTYSLHPTPTPSHTPFFGLGRIS